MQVSRLERYQACTSLLEMVRDLPKIRAEAGFYKGLEYKDERVSIHLRKKLNHMGGTDHQLEVKVVGPPARLMSMRLRSVGNADDLVLLHQAVLGALGSFVNKDLLSDRPGIVNGQQNTPSVGIDDIMQAHGREKKQPIAVSDISMYFLIRYQRQ